MGDETLPSCDFPALWLDFAESETALAPTRRVGVVARLLLRDGVWFLEALVVALNAVHAILRLIMAVFVRES